ncbi:ankyrin, partial [Anaeromyces robustus]
KENTNNETPLFMACENGNENLVKFLIEHGAIINKENRDNKTPLFLACENGNENIVKYLVEHGANTNIETQFD